MRKDDLILQKSDDTSLRTVKSFQPPNYSANGASSCSRNECSSTSQDIPRNQKFSAEVIIKSFIAGGVAGCCAKTTVAPLDRTKILMQVHSHAYTDKISVWSILTNIKKQEGFVGWYRGNLAMLIRVFPYAALQFCSYEQYKRIFSHTFGPDSHFARGASGSCAGLTAVAFTYPLDFVRTRLAYQTRQNKVYSSYINAFTKIYKSEGGMRAFYRGITASWIGMIPYAGISFYTYESLRRICLRSRWDFICKTNPTNPDELVLRHFVNLIIGGIAGAFAQTVSYPCDVTRRRMQLGKLLPHSDQYSNIIKTLIFVYKQHGILNGLYKGLSVNYLRIIPQTSVSFTVYEFMKGLLNLQTGIPIKTG